MNIPQISIIIPVYNVEKYLANCVDSVLSQSIIDFELLLVDDGSTDQSGKICDEYAKKDSRIRVIHQNNGGVSRARNIGLSYAKGEFVTFIDSDDCIGDSYLSDFGIYKYKADIYFQGYNIKQNGIISKHTFPVRDISVVTFDELFVVGELNNILNSPVCKLFRRETILENHLRFDENISFGEDHLFVLSYLLYVKIFVVSSSASYCYIQHDGISLTKKIVPISKIIYYAVNVNHIQNSLIAKFSCNKKRLIAVVNWRRYSNMIIAIKNYINCKVKDTDDFSAIRSAFERINSRYIGLGIHQRILQYVFFHFPSSVSYLIFWLYAHIR